MVVPDIKPGEIRFFIEFEFKRGLINRNVGAGRLTVDIKAL
jgi:hypothetical protein